MPTSDHISESVFKDTITHAVQNVFKTMFNATALLAEEPQTAAHDATENTRDILIEGQLVVGTVGFIGDISGLIYLYMSAPFANQLAGHILGMTEEELEESGDEVVNDAVGEVTNMTVGVFKNQLCDHGYPCKLTIPSILRGSNFSIEPITSASRRIYRFKIGTNILVADLLMKQGD
ncbi:chemotaxis protein CheX [Rariglobus hedericola]|uniref:Chemotaxis protein CheX n=1 Tax=Rariglobus hedericola TaxID=2597822 RepID=A0A556QPN0_9BACT|nr:chemotaxis protein CheX [Rariglobus hedericola]TSJ78589.1 chemotaxis protein CheX [Rariglobus hedericola]